MACESCDCFMPSEPFSREMLPDYSMIAKKNDGRAVPLGTEHADAAMNSKCGELMSMSS